MIDRPRSFTSQTVRDVLYHQPQDADRLDETIVGRQRLVGVVVAWLSEALLLEFVKLLGVDQRDVHLGGLLEHRAVRPLEHSGVDAFRFVASTDDIRQRRPAVAGGVVPVAHATDGLDSPSEPSLALAALG
jgi:hypothetical protein